MYLVKFTSKNGGYVDGYKTARRAKDVTERVNASKFSPFKAEYLGEEKKYYAKEKAGLVPKIG